ncbi:MAG: hypothetical protein ACODAB_04795 [Gemmatimonadota bacterium]
MRRFITSACTAAALLFVAAPAQAQDMPAPPEGETATVTATVVDLACKFTHNLSGDEHRMCAQVCADKGVPLVLLGSDGTVYLPAGEGMPSDGQNERLKEFAEQKVEVSGEVFEAGGARVIRIDDVKRA